VTSQNNLPLFIILTQQNQKNNNKTNKTTKQQNNKKNRHPSEQKHAGTVFEDSSIRIRVVRRQEIAIDLGSTEQRFKRRTGTRFDEMQLLRHCLHEFREASCSRGAVAPV